MATCPAKWPRCQGKNNFKIKKPGPRPESVLLGKVTGPCICPVAQTIGAGFWPPHRKPNHEGRWGLPSGGTRPVKNHPASWLSQARHCSVGKGGPLLSAPGCLMPSGVSQTCATGPARMAIAVAQNKIGRDCHA